MSTFVLGWKGLAREVTEDKADSLVAAGMCRVSRTPFSGPLTGATVLEFEWDYLVSLCPVRYREHEAFRLAWAGLVRFCPRGREFTVPVPLAVGGGELPAPARRR